MRKVKILICALVLLMGVSLTACGGGEMSVEEAYDALVTNATEGNYLEGWQVYQTVPELAEYEDAAAYNDYCVAMRAYEAGGIGYAYGMLKQNPDILDASNTIAALDAEIGVLNGVYKADNGQGSYLYLIIQDGKVGTELIGYYDSQELVYDESDLYNTIVKGNYTDGREFYAVGMYSTTGAEITPNYVMDISGGSIMMIKYETYEYDTFNGMYTKIK